MRKPELYQPGLSSSFTFAFHDPTGDLSKDILSKKRVFVLGVHAAVKRWTPASKRPRPGAAPASEPAQPAAPQPAQAPRPATRPRDPDSPGRTQPAKKVRPV